MAKKWKEDLFNRGSGKPQSDPPGGLLNEDFRGIGDDQLKAVDELADLVGEGGERAG